MIINWKSVKREDNIGIALTPHWEWTKITGATGNTGDTEATAPPCSQRSDAAGDGAKAMV